MRVGPVVSLASALALAALAASCADPVRDARVRALGDEDPNVPVGVDHRPGQPCLVCHAEGGPASDQPFAVAGTIYATDDPRSPGAPGIVVRFVDANGGAPNVEVATSASGNFFVTPSQWPDLAFPLRVAIFDAGGKPLRSMQTTIDREGSCNLCHDPHPDDSRRSIGAIYTHLAGAP